MSVEWDINSLSNGLWLLGNVADCGLTQKRWSNCYLQDDGSNGSESFQYMDIKLMPAKKTSPYTLDKQALNQFLYRGIHFTNGLIVPAFEETIAISEAKKF